MRRLILHLEIQESFKEQRMQPILPVKERRQRRENVMRTHPLWENSPANSMFATHAFISMGSAKNPIGSSFDIETQPIASALPIGVACNPGRRP
jgi:hypothetical protein